MKARKSQVAKVIFKDETKARTVLKQIHTASKQNSKVSTMVKAGQKNFRVNEL